MSAKRKKIVLALTCLVVVAGVLLSVTLANAITAASLSGTLTPPAYSAETLHLEADIVGLTPDQFSPENHAGAGYVKKAETANLELYLGVSDFLVHGESGGYVPDKSRKRYDIAVYDKRSQKLWHSLVDDDKFVHTDYAGTLTAQFQSLVTFSYVDEKKKNDQLIDYNVMQSEDTTVDTQDIANGVRISYTIPDLDLGFSLDFKLGADFLDVSIPPDLVKESIHDIGKANSANAALTETVSSLQDQYAAILNDFRNDKVLAAKIDRINRNLLNISGGNSSPNLYREVQGDSNDLLAALNENPKYQDNEKRIAELLQTLGKAIQYLNRTKLCGIFQFNVLPYFGSADNTTDGYAFYPDACGAISYFRNYHSIAAQGFKQDIYSNNTLDLATYEGYSRYNDTNEHEDFTSVRMPVFGVKQGQDAFAVIVAEGDSNASITYNPSFSSIAVSNIYSSYYFRAVTQNTKSDGTVQDVIDSNFIAQPRTQRYVFLPRESADYSGMAVAYRTYLESHRLIHKSATFDTKTMPLDLTIFMGLYSTEDTVSDKYTRLTSFSEAQSILKRFADANVPNMNVTLRGWTTAGDYNKQPDYKNAPEPTIGGKSGLLALADWAKHDRVRLSLDASNNMYGNKDDMHYADIDGITVKNYGGFTVSYYDNYLLNPIAIFNRNLQALDLLKSYRVASLNYSALGKYIYGDYNKKAPVSRADAKNFFTEFLRQVRERFGSVSADNSNIYAAKYADYLRDVPEKDSGYLFTDECVPFMQIVLHGLVPYTGMAYNTMSDTKLQQLKAVEYGYVPTWILTEKTPQLKSSYIDFLFSSSAAGWQDDILKTYRDYTSKAGSLWQEKIMRQEKLDDSLHRITFENGAQIYLNYSNSDRTYEGVQISAMDYTIVR